MRPISEVCWTDDRTTKRGYVSVKIGDKHHLRHRLAYELLVGPIPPELEIDHLCRNKACFNITHLEAVPHQVNALRRSAVKWGIVCKNGHDRATNTYVRPSGHRSCRACHRELMARRRVA